MKVIVLEAVENESAAKLLARKVLANRTDISYMALLERLATGNVEYFYSLESEGDANFKNAIYELEKLGVKYRIIEMDEPAPSATVSAVQTPPQTPQTPAAWTEAASAIVSDEWIEETLRSVSAQEIRDVTRDLPKSQNYIEPYYTEKKPKNGLVLKVIFTLLIIAAIVFLADTFSGGTKKMPQTRPSRQEATQRDAALFNNALNEADRACVEGAIDTEKMYRVAISFNRNNLRAWHGLLNCFEKRGDSQRIANVREEMRALFGDDIFSASSVVSLHGEMETFSAENEVCRITYSRNPRAGEVERELHAVALGVAGSNSCSRAVIFAQESAGVGYMISVTLSQLPRNFEEFRRTVTVNRVGK